MRVMVIVKASKESEAGVLPDTEGLTKMLKYNEELVKAGVILAGDGLQPTSKGKYIHLWRSKARESACSMPSTRLRSSSARRASAPKAPST